MRRWIAATLIAAAALAFYLSEDQLDLPGLYSDEASIAWNALTIADMASIRVRYHGAGSH